ncbi:MAG TPA: hypothetical protein VM073_11855 [Usitatibacter sp.]|nr:hypothetical protein [Usitatibacter sp.]
MSRHFLYLTNTRLVSVLTQGKRLVARREFAVSGAGAAEFERHLAGVAEVPTHIFTDLTEEDFRLDTIPHVGAGDRDAIVARKLSQMFRSTPYRHAVMQGREGEGRRDDRVMYTAVTNGEVLRPWVEAIERHKVPLAGIYSAAVFSSVLLEELDLVFPHTLLVTFTPGEAMRQTYFRDNEIKFSRLTPVDLDEGQTLGAMIAEETTRTWQYLDSLRHFGAEDRLEVCVLVHPNDRPAVQPELRDFAQIQYRVIDIEQASMKLGLKPAPLDSTSEEVMIHLFLLRPASNHFASSELRRHATLRRARIGLNQASVAVLAAGIAWAGYNATRLFQSSEVDSRVAAQLAELNREHDEIVRSTPSFGAAGSTMRDAVTFYNGAIKPFPSMPEFLAPVSGVLGAHPEVRLWQLSWQATDDLKAIAPITNTATRNAPSVKAIARSDAAPPGAIENAQNPPFAGGRYQVALLEATVRVGQNDFRGALEKVERLAEAIATVPGYRAEVAESPLDVRSSLALQGRHGPQEPAMMEPRFVLRVVRERAGPA